MTVETTVAAIQEGSGLLQLGKLSGVTGLLMHHPTPEFRVVGSTACIIDGRMQSVIAESM